MAGNHGGAQFELLASGAAREGIVPADVLDAWFDPAPGVVEVLQQEAGWMARSSPPAYARDLEELIADSISVARECVVLGAGSSDLIFRCLREQLTRKSRVFLIDPTYSEYRYVCSQVAGCRVDCGPSFDFMQGKYDLIVVVNPNNPTGELCSTAFIESLKDHLTENGVVWVDEAYLPYVGAASMKRVAAQDRRFVVCQSMSKSLALSGLRVAHLVADAEYCRRLRASTPPWSVSTPAWLAAKAALADVDYYEARYAETRRLRARLAADLGCGKEGAGNWVTLVAGRPASEVVAECRERGVLVRGGEGMFLNPPRGFLRIAVRSEAENARCVAAVRDSLTAGIAR